MNPHLNKKIRIYCDGGARGNPGPAAIGVTIEIPEKTQTLIKSVPKNYGEFIGTATNNVAEYNAVIFAMKKIKQLIGKKNAAEANLLINTDSELLYKQIKGEYKILEPDLQLLFIEIWNLKQDFKNTEFKLIPREKNKDADRLANEALDKVMKM